ncbi:hypothetical protein ACQP04_03450 [Pseudonocardia halophobica]|uniref:hypothetical protein n=1 Tax=Pseudonocardia halophobica TaxID=29401 RepID=UPI003D8BD2E3
MPPCSKEASTTPAAGAVEAGTTARWLDDARRLDRHAPRVDRGLAHARPASTPLNSALLTTVDRVLRQIAPAG